MKDEPLKRTSTPSPFEKWSGFWQFISQGNEKKDWCADYYFRVQNFYLEEIVPRALLADYRHAIETALPDQFNLVSNADFSEVQYKLLLSQWRQADESYWGRSIRATNSMSFQLREKSDSSNILESISKSHWLIQLRRLDNLFDPKLKTGVFAEKVNDKIRSMQITYDKVKGSFDEWKSSEPTSGDQFNEYLQALNTYYEAGSRFGQPVHAALASDFVEYFLPNSLHANSARPQIRTGGAPDLGTIVRNRLAIPYKSGEAVLLLCYQVSTLDPQQANQAGLARPCIVDVDPKSTWFCPAPTHYGRCGQTVSVNPVGPYKPCCELVHQQLPAKPPHCIWVGRIDGDLPKDPAPNRKQHWKHVDVPLSRCSKHLEVCNGQTGCQHT